jgi:hypothetical protein
MDRAGFEDHTVFPPHAQFQTKSFQIRQHRPALMQINLDAAAP